MNNKNNRKIILLCTGLGHIQRGFEMYISSLALKLAAATTVEVWCGGEAELPGVKTRRITNIFRNSLVGKFLGEKAFLWEQRTFALGMLPFLFQHKNAVFYLGEYQLYCYLYKIRNLFGLNYSLVLYTGGQALPGLFNPRLDFVHHVTDVYLHECRHIPNDRQFILPHFIEDDFIYDAGIQQAITSKANGKKIVLSVGLIDKKIKRMDLLVQCLAALPFKVFPVLLGEYAADTAAIKKMLEDNFGKDGFILQKVSHRDLGNWYQSADLFVLCSPKESFGIAMLEALYHGLPVICDNFSEARFVLKSQGHYVDMSSLKDLSAAVEKELATQQFPGERKQFVAAHYTWPALRDSYKQMFETILENRIIPATIPTA